MVLRTTGTTYEKKKGWFRVDRTVVELLWYGMQFAKIVLQS